jgi:hypothetical protein
MFAPGSGRPGGGRGESGQGEWRDRILADEETQHLADRNVAGGGRRGLLAGGVCWDGRAVGRAVAGGGELDVAAACGAGEQDTLQRGGAQDAATQAGEDQREIGGAEAAGNRRKTGCGGAVAGGVGEVAAVVQQDADDVQECRDARGRRERMGGWRLLTIHGSYSNSLRG